MRGPLAKLKPGELSPLIEMLQRDRRLKFEARVPATRAPLVDARRSIRDHLHKTHAAKIQRLVPR